MPEVRVIYVRKEIDYTSYDRDDNYETKVFWSNNIHDWETISNEELKILQNNLRDIYKFDHNEYPVVLVKDPVPVKKRIESIKEALKEVEAKKRLAKEKAEQRKKIKEAELRKQMEEQEKELLENLKRKYETK